MTKISATSVTNERFVEVVTARLDGGARFAGLFASAFGDGTRLWAVLDDAGDLVVEQTEIAAGVTSFPSLSSRIPSARWYEREIHDLFGIRPDDAGVCDPLVFPFEVNFRRPRLGSGSLTETAQPNLTPLKAQLHGEGVFTLSYGPVRSGVFESIEYLLETPGEDIPHLRTRIFYKHRGLEERFAALSFDDGVLLAERSEGVASVAHAVAYCSALETLASVEVPLRSQLVRALHAELERIANHLDSTVRHTEASGQAVAYARFSLHKERVQRLRAHLCGSRFGRGVVVPGGVASEIPMSVAQLLIAVDELDTAVDADSRLLMDTPSFLDRLRETGVMSFETVKEFGALGPLARGSGFSRDVRWSRPYGAYARLTPPALAVRNDGDALARQRVRVEEIRGSFELIRECAHLLDELGRSDDGRWAVPITPVDGRAFGWAEAPQGELLTLVEVQDGSLVRVKPRSASFHNLALFPSAFPKDILTDFAFIEASFGLSIAGVAS